MAIITISRGCFSHGQEISEKVAQSLGYECISREILIEASRFFNIPERKLLKSIHDAPTVLDRITHGKEKYLSFIEAAIFEHVRKDNMVYHGHAGHLLLRGFPQILKVRIIAEMEDRIQKLCEENNLTPDQAHSYIKKDDEQRSNWTKYLYKKDVSDPELYDIVLKIGTFSVEDAVAIIVEAAKRDSFKLTPESKRKINDLSIESHLRAVLANTCEIMHIQSNDGWVHIRCRSLRIKKFDPISPNLQRHLGETLRDDLYNRVKETARLTPGVRNVDCVVESPDYE
jgi:cytidylate kinase